MIAIEHIKNRILELRQLDTNFSICGAQIHQYEWNQTLNEKETDQIERENNIYLSDDYKDLLMKLGNGGVGPGLGMAKISLDEINPPYPGTTFLLRNCKNPNIINDDMVNVDEISGIINLFNYGSGITCSLIVTGVEKGDLIQYDYNGRFQKLKSDINALYQDWATNHLTILKRVQQKLLEIPLDELIDSEWQLKNFSVREMVLSLIHAKPNNISSRTTEEYLQEVYKAWETKNKTNEAL